jgi:AbiV family abortive infection protein
MPSSLFERQSFGSAAFLAITAMEETAKAHVGSFRRDNPGPRPKGRDPFRDHTAKHSMAILPTVFMSQRIVDALGRERAKALEREAQETGFTIPREAGLYCARGPNGFESPRTAIRARLAWELSILAIEAADDALVGSTNHSYRVGEEFERFSRNWGGWLANEAARRMLAKRGSFLEGIGPIGGQPFAGAARPRPRDNVRRPSRER